MTVSDGTPAADGSNALAMTLLIGGAYGLCVGTLMLGNSFVFPPSEVPFVGYWILWGLFFSPAVLVTALANAFTAPGPRRRWTLAGGSLGATLLVMECCYAMDVTLSTVALALVGLSLAVVTAYRLAG